MLLQKIIHYTEIFQYVIGAKIVIHFKIPIGDCRLYLQIYLNLIYQFTRCHDLEGNKANSEKRTYNSKPTSIYH